MAKRLQSSLTLNKNLEEKLNDRSIIVDKTEIAFKANLELVAAKDELIKSLIWVIMKKKTSLKGMKAVRSPRR